MEIIWGIQFQEILLLVTQIGLAVVGAASLWGFVLSTRDTRAKKPSGWVIDDWLAMKLFSLVFVGTLIAAFAHFVFSGIVTVAHAHEGISAEAHISEIIAVLPILKALFTLPLLGVFGMVLVRVHNEERFSHLITPFYAVTSIVAFIMTSLSAWRGVFDVVQLFHFMHGFHSIFTIGSVIVLDTLFIISSRSAVLKQHVYALFSAISKVIWVGLGIDFISTFLIADHALFNQKFLFTQTVIAILIINGAILSGPIARNMMRTVSSGGGLESRWRTAGHVAGAISITSWFTITALDFSRTITLGYGELALLYMTLIACVFIGHLIFEAWEARKFSPVFEPL